MRLLNLSIVTGITLLANLLGLAREIVTARFLGASNDYDCFVAAFSIISLFIVLFNQQNIQTLYMSDYHRTRLHDENLSNQLKVNFGLYIIAVTVIIGVLIYCLAHPLIQMLFSSFSIEKVSLTVHLVRIMLPIIVMNATLGVLYSYYHSRNQFLYPSMGQLINGIMTVALLFVRNVNVEWLAYSYLISMTACWLFTLWPLLRKSRSFKLGPEDFAKNLIKNGVFILAISVIEQSLQLWYRSCFSLFGTGALSEFGYTWKLIYFPIYLVGFSISTAFLPQISNEISQKKLEMSDIKICSQITLTLLSFSATFMYLFAEDISFVLFGNSAMTAESLSKISILLQEFSPYIVVTGMNIYFGRLLHLCKQSRSLLTGLFYITMLQVIVTKVMLTQYGQLSISLNATLFGLFLMFFQIHLIKKKGINVLSLSECLWSCCPSLIGISIIYLITQPFTPSVTNLFFVGTICLLFTSTILVVKKEIYYNKS